ncbi:zinc finger protein 280C isoform 1-T3 [Trichechus inunguis]|uniref:Zinc finger protein 280C isoform X1 n=1 Tax=Trichechus manatus latirostris TaxID=127582 RepID=A0A2Y9RDN0_TRIMA|nr:zinc finger protein 280C isoform X1 [Trichechus manatus latirostris]XP_023590064.1 zinc finger protein 280C isoform X1 [Trichechus manatus latirostris]XP_023590065.1 zinc finger protein 280C isoform X1 [Trichechus manatus latirostris]
MDDDNSLQPENNSKMAELFMECEEEELEPWQKRVEETENEDDDELIFVGEISSSKPAISNILNRGNSSSSSLRSVKSESLSPGIPEIFRSPGQPVTNRTPSPATSPKSKSSQGSVTVENSSKPDLTTNSSQSDSEKSSVLLFDFTQEPRLTQQTQASSPEDTDQSSPSLKRPSTSEVNSVNPKMPKPSEGFSDISDISTSSSVTSSQVVLSQGTDTSPSQNTTGTPCPKCNVMFSLLDPLKYHMKRCCPDMINNFLENTNSELPNTEDKKMTGSEKGKLIMLVSDFYYGRHEGTVEEQKTYTTFKCFSCLKVLKNNIRFMNHMKHHLELEKQNSESWENHTTCQHCYRQYPTPFQLQCHIESTHTPHEFSTICKICELSFESEHTLLQHMKDTHKPGEMPYICQVCQYRSSSFSEVETHFRTSHENTKNLLCPFCLKVSKMATPYMNHYMKHQKKGIHRCTKCRLQFLTCKEKTDHKIQHRTFIKPKELEGLPPGTKVTIRASLGPLQSKPSTTLSSDTPSTSLQVSPPISKTKTGKNTTKSNASKSKTSKPHATTSTASKPKASKASGVGSKFKPQASYKLKKQRNRKSKISTALKNLRFRRGVHKCIECRSKIKDFASHFSTYGHCNFCKYNSNCSKAFVNHMMSCHSSNPSKRFCIFKKNSGAIRGITLVCLKCDFLTDSSGLDLMAKHLSQRKTHTCQVIKESVSENTSTSAPTSDCLLN